MNLDDISVYFCYLLRHHPEAAKLDLDEHGWVDFDQFIQNVNKYSDYKINEDVVVKIVNSDKKSRYRLEKTGDKYTRIKCCQGHSIPWVKPELKFIDPPKTLYHGTTEKAYKKILESGKIDKMSRHAVHTHADLSIAWQSARRWRIPAVVLEIDAEQMTKDGYVFGVSENGVWCVDEVPTKYIVNVLR